MSESYYRDHLYPLQDKVLYCIDKINTPFYLTGGTALSRCYLDHRYSDDLDFFQNSSNSFTDDAIRIIEELEKQFLVQPGIKDDSFYRIFVKEFKGDTELKIEFINDVYFHKGALTAHPLFSKIDSWENILSNKITALSRNAPKDIVDIVFLSLKFPFSWEEIVADARRKDAWVNEIVVSKIIYDFNVSQLSEVQWIKKEFLDFDFSDTLKIIARELLHGFDNSLKGKIKV